MKRRSVSKENWELACRLAIQSAMIEGFNTLVQDGCDIKTLSFFPDELRNIADQFDELIKRETRDD